MKNLLQYQAEPDGSRAQWATGRIRPFLEKTLDTIVPSGFEKYLRLFQPAWRWPQVDSGDWQAFEDIAAGRYGWEHATPVRWRDVALETGKTAHRLMQWESIAPAPVELGEAGISTPIEYRITPEMVDALFRVLIEYSGPEEDCLCAFWTGYAEHAFLEAAGNVTVSGLGQQTYYLFHAPLATVQEQWSSVLKGMRLSSALAPNAVWPASKAWYYAVPIGPMTSYLGGPAQLLEEILNCVELETWEAFPDDNIWFDPLLEQQ